MENSLKKTTHTTIIDERKDQPIKKMESSILKPFKSSNMSFSSKKRKVSSLELLHKAAMSGNVSKIREYLQLQNELLYKTNDTNGSNVLHIVSRSGHWKAVELLMNPPFSANKSLENWAGHNALYLALMNASPGLELTVHMLGGLNYRNTKGRPPLIECCRLRHLDVLRTLIRLQFARNAWIRQNPLSFVVKCDGGKTPLHYACESKDVCTVGLILGNNREVLRAITSHGDVVRILVSGLETHRRELMKRDAIDYEEAEKINMIRKFLKVARSTQTVAIEGRVIDVFEASNAKNLQSEMLSVAVFGTCVCV